MVMLRRLFKAIQIALHREGRSYFRYLLMDVLVPKAASAVLTSMPVHRLRQFVKLLGLCAVFLSFVVLSLLFGPLAAIFIVLGLGSLGLLVRAGVCRRRILRMQRQARVLTEKARATHTDTTFTSLGELSLEGDTLKAITAARKSDPAGEITIGRIDQEGRVFGLYGPLPKMDSVDEDSFIERYRYKLSIVLVGKKVLVLKDFQGDRIRFIREWHNLAVLYGKANVPAISHVNEDKCQLYMNLIPGRTVRDVLADAGAKIRGPQVKDDPELTGLAPAERAEKVAARGTAIIKSCISEEFLAKLEKQLDKIHSCGVAGIELKFGNIVVNPIDSSPYLVDFETPQYYRTKTSPIFVFKRNRGRDTLNRLYKRNLRTEESARRELAEHAAKVSTWYAPLDFGNGLTVGPFWSVDVGTGRWQFLNKYVVGSLVQGKRVLDLGANNGAMSVMMLRAGARQVVAVELSKAFCESARLVHSLYEWRDIRDYKMEILNCNMLDVLSEDWGKFDVVTSFCSLYYLEADDMARVVRKASQLAPVMIIQGKVKMGPEESKEKAEKCSVAFLKGLLEDNGFPKVEIFAPAHFSRPLLVGKTRCY